MVYGDSSSRNFEGEAGRDDECMIELNQEYQFGDECGEEESKDSGRKQDEHAPRRTCTRRG